MTSPANVPRVVLAIDRSRSATERARAIGHARLQARLVRRHVLADGVSGTETIAAWKAMLDAEAGAGHPLPETWRNWWIGAPELLACIEAALGKTERTAA